MGELGHTWTKMNLIILADARAASSMRPSFSFPLDTGLFSASSVGKVVSSLEL